MKRRVLSLFLAFALCFSSLPMPTFAEKTDVVTEQEETEVVMEQEEAEEPAEPETPSDENATEDDSDTAKDTSIDGETIDDTTDESAGDGVVGEEDEQDTEKNEEEDEAVQAVQALIDALPDEVTEENVESIGEQLAAIDEAMAELTEEQIAKLDMTRYDAICAALNGLVAVQDDAHTHYLCGEDDCNGVGEHRNHSLLTGDIIIVIVSGLSRSDCHLTCPDRVQCAAIYGSCTTAILYGIGHFSIAASAADG